MASISIRLGGVPIETRVLWARSSFTGRADGNPGSAEIVINNSDRGISLEDAQLQTLELYVDGVREWDGWCFGVVRTWPFDADDTTVPADTPIFWVLKGLDRNLLFQKRVMFNTADPSDNRGFKIWPADTSDKTAIEHALANYVDLSSDGLTQDIENIASPSPWEEFTLGYVSAPMGTLFEDCSEMTGGVFWIGPDRALHYKSDRTVTAPFTLSDLPSAGQVGYRDLHAVLDYSQAATEALVWGAGRGSPDPVFAKYTNETAEDDYGLWQWGDTYIGAFLQQTVNRRARTYVLGSPTHRRGHDEPVPNVSMTIFEPGIRVGMVAKVVSQVYDYEEDLPVRSSKMTFPTPTSVQYGLELSLTVDTPFGIPDPWWTGEDPRYGEALPPGGGMGQESFGAPLLIDHYDVPLPTSFESTYRFIGPVLVYASQEWIPIMEHPNGGITKYTFLLPSYVEDGDLVLLHGLPGIGIDGANNTSPTWHDGNSAQWSWGSYASNFWGTGRIRTALGASTTEVFCHGNGNLPAPFVVSAMITVVKGKASSGVIDGTGVAVFDPTQSYPSLSGDGSAVVGSGFNVGAFALPAQCIALGGLTVSTGVDSWDGGMCWKYIGDSYVAGDIVWPSSAPGPGVYKPTERWWRIYDNIEWKTPGPDVTGHNEFPGGNEYYVFGNPAMTIYSPDDSEVQFERPTVAPYVNGLAVWDDYRGYIDDPDGTRGPEISQGEWVNDPDNPPAPWQGPMHWLIKLRADEIGANYGLFELEHNFMDLDPGSTPSELDAAGTELYSVAWLGEIFVGVYFWNGTVELDVYNAWWSGTGILNDLHPDTSSDYTDGDLVYTVYAPWEHNWYWDPLFSGVSADTEFYLRVDETQIYDAAAGARKLRVKLWKADEQEPDEWLVDDVLPMYKAAAFKHLGYDSVSGELDAGDYSGSWATSFEIFGRSTVAGGTHVGLDAIWSVPELGSLVADTAVPLYESAGASKEEYYVLRYPYRPGSLVLEVDGEELTPGEDFLETDPSAGEFRLLSPVASPIYANYQPSGTDTTYSGGAVYRPQPQAQYGWGTPLDGYNCMMACAAMALDRHTVGQYTQFSGTPRANAPNMRGFQYDQVEGTDIGDAATAWSNGWGQTMHSPGSTTWATFVSKINEGRGGILAGLYSRLPAAKRFSSYAGGHAIYINEQFPNGNFLGMDPLRPRTVIYTPAELQAFAVGLFSPGMVSAGFTGVTS